MRAKNVTFEPVGLNNRTDPIDMLPVELTVADNVDLRRGKSARRRKGGSQVLAGKFYSFWDDTISAFVCKDDSGVFTLNEFLGDFSLKALATLTVGTPVSFQRVNAVTVVSNGVDLGFISEGSFVAPTVPTEQHMRATVPGELLTEQNGRLLIAKGRSLYFTEAYDLEAMDERFCQIPLPETPTMLIGLKTGVWTSYRGMVTFLEGAGPDEYRFRVKANYEAVRGTARKTDVNLFLKDQTGDAAIFMTNKGVCLGTEQGTLIPLTAEQISAGVGSQGAGLVREDNGYVHYIGSVQDPSSAINAYTPKDIDLNAWSAETALYLLTSSQP